MHLKIMNSCCLPQLTSPRIRRVKCDERKPSCTRCTSTGRKCDGYGNAVAGTPNGTLTQTHSRDLAAMSATEKFTTKPRIPKQPSNNPDCTLKELQYMDIFCRSPSSVYSTWRKGHFWKYQVPLYAASEPSVRHAMVALGVIQEQMNITRQGIPEDFRLQPQVSAARKIFAVRHYNIAVTQLRKVMDQKDATVIALINSALFVMIDFIWGNYATALVHLHCGIEILRRWQKERLGDRPVVEGSIEDSLIKVFESLSSRPSMTNGPSADIMSDNPEGGAFATLAAAQQAMNLLQAERSQLIRLGARVRGGVDKLCRSTKLKDLVAAHRTKLDTWSKKFEALVPCLESHLTNRDEEIIDELRITNLTSIIWLWAGIPIEQSQPVDTFYKLIDQAFALHEKLLQRRHHEKNASFSVSIFPLVSLLATKSQDISLKKRACVLLGKLTPGAEIILKVLDSGERDRRSF